MNQQPDMNSANPLSGLPADTITASVTETAPEVAPAAQLVVVEGPKWVYGEGNLPFITGIVENLSRQEFSYVEISFPIFDKEGNQIDTVMDNMSDLKAEARWKFKVGVLDKDVHTFGEAALTYH